MLGALDPLAYGQQGGELIPGPGRIPRLPGPESELVAGGQGVGVLGALDPHSDGRAYYDRKIAEGKTHKEALRCLKRRISDAIYARLLADARQGAATSATDPGGQPGNDSVSSAAGSHPGHRLFGQVVVSLRDAVLA